MKILGISGSLRQGSLNTSLLHAVSEIISNDISFELIFINKIVHYNEDLDNDDKPESVKEFLNSISNSNAVLFSSPEYNHGMSGVLKNAIDWASRPAFESPFPPVSIPWGS